MPLPKFDYLKPKTVEELAGILADHAEDAKIFAGGTDLLVLMRDRLVRPKYLVDIKEIEELRRLSHDGEKGLTIGAAVTLNEIIESDVVREHFGVLRSAANTLADYNIRNRATLVGNICNASPAADTAPALLVLDAEVEIASREGERTIPIQEFFKGIKRTALELGEFVKSVKIPNPPEGAKGEYLKWGRIRGEDLAVVGVAALVANSGKKLVRIALSSVAPTPILISVDGFFEGGSLEERIDKVASIVVSKISPISDVRASREYRLHMTGVLTRRVLKQLLEAS